MITAPRVTFLVPIEGRPGRISLSLRRYVEIMHGLLGRVMTLRCFEDDAAEASLDVREDFQSPRRSLESIEHEITPAVTQHSEALLSALG